MTLLFHVLTDFTSPRRSEKRAEDLVRFLTDRGYKKAYVEDQVEKVGRLTRAEARNNTNQPRSTKTPFVVTYHPGLPNIRKIIRELHPILESSERCKNAINSVPFVAFRKPKSLGDYLVRAKVDSRGHRDSILGTVKCSSRRCEVCKYMEEKSHFMNRTIEGTRLITTLIVTRVVWFI